MDRMTAISHRVETAQLENVMMLDGRRLSPLFVVKNENIAFPFTPSNKLLKSPNYKSVNQWESHDGTMNEIKPKVGCFVRRDWITVSPIDIWALTDLLRLADAGGQARSQNAIVPRKFLNRVRYVECDCENGAWQRQHSIRSPPTMCVSVADISSYNMCHSNKQRAAILSLALRVPIVYITDDNSMNWKHSLSLTHSHTATTSVDNQSLGDELWILMISILKYQKRCQQQPLHAHYHHWVQFNSCETSAHL